MQKEQKKQERELRLMLFQKTPEKLSAKEKEKYNGLNLVWGWGFGSLLEEIVFK